ncbi:MAG: cation-transporting P-type ATPase [Planctomycetota bacterium]
MAPTSLPAGTASAPWTRTAADSLADQGVDANRGLSETEATQRRRQVGPNALARRRRRSTWRVLIDQLRSLITLLLLAAAALAFVFGERLDAVAIAAVIALNTLIGFCTEIRAVYSMEALRRLGRTTARVRRDGIVRELPAAEVVPGDILLCTAGDIVGADVRLVQASGVQVDESALTGESVPVTKTLTPVPAETGLAERGCMMFQGTAVTRGTAEGVVLATGTRTEVGRIAELVEAADSGDTPLERRLERLGRQLAWASCALAAAIALAGLATGKDLFLVVETAIALAVATVPEGLPIVSTLALARGMWRMAQRHALVEHLPAVETLGSTNVILTDKTGTLTENRMTVTTLAQADAVWTQPPEDAAEDDTAGALPDFAREALELGALCNAADRGDGRSTASGDPMETALLRAASEHATPRRTLVAARHVVHEFAFDPDLQMMATVHEDAEGRLHFAVKGAPEAVMAHCVHARAATGDLVLDAAARAAWTRRQEELAGNGLRVIAVATKVTPPPLADPYRDLTLVALVGLIDPPRGPARAAIEVCRRAGIRVVMLTGDHAATASAVGRAVGLLARGERAVTPGPTPWSTATRRALLHATIVARASPEQKLRVIELFQEAGDVVAMLGDGVNDAPALRRADIGVAMGLRGTQVARQAADMVLGDDELATVPVAIEQGRAIYANLRKFVVYLLSCNLSEVLVIGSASLVDVPLPIHPLQILFLNLVTDVFPALALGFGEGSRSGMTRPPRRRHDAFLGRRHWLGIVAGSLTISAPVLAVFWIVRAWRAEDPAAAVTVAFLTLAAAQLFHIFNMSDREAPTFANEVTANPWVWGALAICTGLMLAAMWWPPLASVLATVPLDAGSWVLVLGASAVPLCIGRAHHWLGRTRRAAK